MSLKEICNEIRELKSSDEELAFERLQDILIDFMREYTCDNEFYLYSVDNNNNYDNKATALIMMRIMVQMVNRF